MAEYRVDRISLDAEGTRVEFTDENFAIIHDPVISRTGVYVYRNADGTERREYRPPEAVFAQPVLDSIAGKPFTNDHPPEFVTPQNFSRYAAGTIGDRAYRSSLNGVPVVRVSRINVHDAQTIADLRAGKREISPGYWADYQPSPGVAPDGSRYDGIQTPRTVNHVSLVSRGRGGIVTRLPRVDSGGAQINWAIEARQDSQETNMPSKYFDAFVNEENGQFEVRMGDPPWDVLATFETEEEATAEVDRLHAANDPRSEARGEAARSRWFAWKEQQENMDGGDAMPGTTKIVVIDGVGHEIPAELVPAIKTLQSKRDQAQARADRLEGERDAAKQRIDELEALPRFDAQAMKERRSLERSAQPFLPDGFNLDEADDRAIREAVVSARMDGVDLTNRSDDYLQGLFDSIVKTGGEESGHKSDSQSRRRSHRADAEPAVDTSDADEHGIRTDSRGVKHTDLANFRAQRAKQRRDAALKRLNG